MAPGWVTSKRHELLLLCFVLRRPILWPGEAWWAEFSCRHMRCSFLIGESTGCTLDNNAFASNAIFHLRWIRVWFVLYYLEINCKTVSIMEILRYVGWLPSWPWVLGPPSNVFVFVARYCLLEPMVPIVGLVCTSNVGPKERIALSCSLPSC